MRMDWRTRRALSLSVLAVISMGTSLRLFPQSWGLKTPEPLHTAQFTPGLFFLPPDEGSISFVVVVSESGELLGIYQIAGDPLRREEFAPLHFASLK